MSNIRFGLVSLFFFFASLPCALATDNIFTEVQNGLATNLGIGTFASGLLCSFILLLVVMFPMFILSLKSKANTALVFLVIVGIGIQGFCVAILWLPVWLFIFEFLMVAMFFGNKFKDLF